MEDADTIEIEFPPGTAPEDLEAVTEAMVAAEAPGGDPVAARMRELLANPNPDRLAVVAEVQHAAARRIRAWRALARSRGLPEYLRAHCVALAAMADAVDARIAHRLN